MKYLQMGNPSEARRHFSRALSLNDDSAQAHNAMALLYNYERDPEQEEYHYRQALRADRRYSRRSTTTARCCFPRALPRGPGQVQARRQRPQLRRPRQRVQQHGRGLQGARQGGAGPRGLCPLPASESPLQPGAAGAGPPLLRRRPAQAGLGLLPRLRAPGASAERRGAVGGHSPGAALGKRDQQSSYELALQNLYPGSREFRLWRDWRNGQEGAE